MTEIRSDKELGLVDLSPIINSMPNKHIKEFVFAALDVAPDYFWSIPASSSGKHHAEWAVRSRGLVKHTQMAMYIVRELAHTFELSQYDIDCAIAALALHDTLKYGIDYDLRYYDMHPYLPRIYYGEDIEKGGKGLRFLAPSAFPDIMKAIEHHMGSLGSGRWNSMGLIPLTPMHRAVHLADYISSRKGLSYTPGDMTGGEGSGKRKDNL